MLSRIEFVILRTDRSPPAAPHHASLRRSCIRLQAGERLPEEDLHLSDHLRFQAHDRRRPRLQVSLQSTLAKPRQAGTPAVPALGAPISARSLLKGE